MAAVCFALCVASGPPLSHYSHTSQLTDRASIRLPTSPFSPFLASRRLFSSTAYSNFLFREAQSFGDSSVTVSLCQFLECRSWTSGGGAHFDRLTMGVSIERSVFRDCRSEIGGGGFSSLCRNLFVSGSCLIGCDAGVFGRAFLTNCTNNSIRGTSIVLCGSNGTSPIDSIHIVKNVLLLRYFNFSWHDSSVSRDFGLIACEKGQGFLSEMSQFENNSGRSLFSQSECSGSSVFDHCNIVGNRFVSSIFIISTNSDVRHSFIVGNSGTIVSAVLGRPVFMTINSCYCDNWGDLPGFVNHHADRRYGKHDTQNIVVDRYRLFEILVGGGGMFGDRCVFGSSESYFPANVGSIVVIVCVFISLVAFISYYIGKRCFLWSLEDSRKQRLRVGAQLIPSA
jgi:hypothetical protein